MKRKTLAGVVVFVFLGAVFFSGAYALRNASAFPWGVNFFSWKVIQSGVCGKTLYRVHRADGWALTLAKGGRIELVLFNATPRDPSGLRVFRKAKFSYREVSFREAAKWMKEHSFQFWLLYNHRKNTCTISSPHNHNHNHNHPKTSGA